MPLHGLNGWLLVLKAAMVCWVGARLRFVRVFVWMGWNFFFGNLIFRPEISYPHLLNHVPSLFISLLFAQNRRRRCPHRQPVATRRAQSNFNDDDVIAGSASRWLFVLWIQQTIDVMFNILYNRSRKKGDARLEDDQILYWRSNAQHECSTTKLQTRAHTT